MKADELKRGQRVTVTEGPYKGTEGTVNEVNREWDPTTKTTGWRVAIDFTLENGEPETLTTRLAWVRPA